MILAELEDAIIKRLTDATAGGRLGYTLTVGSYAGEFDSEEDLDQARVKFPCALVLLERVGEGRETSTGQSVPLGYTIFVAAQNRRGERARRRGAVGAVGSYQIAWDVRTLLKGQMLGFDDQIQPITPGAITSILNGAVNRRAVSVYACRFATIWFEDLSPVQDDDLGEFLILDAAWDIPPLGNVTPPLPAADPDARDVVHPRGAP